MAAEDSWTSKAPMQEAKGSLGVAVVNGKIYAIGGVGLIQYLSTNEEYDPVTDTWTFKEPMPTPRAYFGIAVYQNKIYVIGGTAERDSGWSPTGANVIYDPATDTWETKASMPTPRIGVQASVVDGKIYLVGGNSSANEVYDPATDSWTTKAPMPVAPGLTRGWSCASVVVDKKIHVIGAFPRSNSHQIYNTETDSWSFGAPAPSGYFAAAGATTGVMAPKRIYVFSIDSEFWPLGLPGFVHHVYDPANDSWTNGASMPTGRFNVGVAVVNDMLYVIGGYIPYIGTNKFRSAVNEQYTPFGYGTVPPDTTSPAISIVSPENKTYTVNNVSLTFVVSEQASWIGYSLAGQANATITGNTALTGLSNGSYSLTVYAKDTSGNTGASETVYFSIEVPPPDPQPSEPFPITWIAVIVIIAVVGAAFLVYFVKVKKTTGKAEKQFMRE
ncbi:MAG: hypothetical protein O2V44_08615 [Candidatus Bathyarchaeota archaeon]|nr:hypothetical protein [Candidatus Bathyarchaeota archaeon]